MKGKYDALVIGAGPAGLACSAELAARGLDVAVLDEQASPGGQIYRNITKASAKQQKKIKKKKRKVVKTSKKKGRRRR